MTRRRFMQAVAAAALLPAAGSSSPAFTVTRRNMWPHDPTSAETLARCDRLLAVDADNVLTLCYRGQVSPFVRAGELAEADLTRAVRLEPDNPALYYVRGVTLNRAPDLQYAIGLLSKGGDIGGKALCTSQPDIQVWDGDDRSELFYMAHRELGSILEQEGRCDEAIAAFEVVASFQVITQANLERWTESSIQVGRWCESVVGIRRLIEMQPRPTYFKRLEGCESWTRPRA
jgi:tetratricopeptide (TPR) repeat protein